MFLRNSTSNRSSETLDQKREAHQISYHSSIPRPFGPSGAYSDHHRLPSRPPFESTLAEGCAEDAYTCVPRTVCARGGPYIRFVSCRVVTSSHIAGQQVTYAGELTCTIRKFPLDITYERIRLGCKCGNTFWLSLG